MHRFATLALALLLGCPGREPPAADAAAPCTATVSLEPIATPSPYPVVSLRGHTANATQVAVSTSGGNVFLFTVGDDGAFCVDIPIAVPATETYTVQAVCDSGASSHLTVVATVTTDRAAPTVADAGTCEGVDPCQGVDGGCGTAADD